MQFREKRRLLEIQLRFLQSMIVRLIVIALSGGLAFGVVAWCENHFVG